jgi:hypothetical protein
MASLMSLLLGPADAWSVRKLVPAALSARCIGAIRSVQNFAVRSRDVRTVRISPVGALFLPCGDG